ncbi:MAG TPA: transglutaminase domain-containing protein [Chthonomonadales bacterium]|nr:transglutaminase domain-containing protein [Chthonomonadales bacterium]
MRAWHVIVCLGAVMASPAGARATFEAEAAAAEAAKAAGNMAAMEQALTRAHRLGPGNEYTWRSLAWAQMHQGRWRESLATARANVRRNGATSWSLAQLYESAMAAGDTGLAQRALADELELPAASRNRCLGGERTALRALTAPTVYELTWKIRVADYKVQRGELVINTPARRHGWQRAEVWVEGARTWRIEVVDRRDVMFIDPGGAAELTLRARVTHTPEVRGGGFAERARHIRIPRDERAELLLGPFRNRIDYDPADPALAEIVAPMRTGTPGQRVQAVLDWLAANVRYVEGYPDDLASILKNRKGVCHHQSNLMVAMCRALGVPALVSHGVRLGAGDGEIRDVVASHGWVEVLLNGRWVGVEPLDPHSLRRFGSGYLVVDATGRGAGPVDDHFLMYTPDGRHIEGIQGLPVSGSSRLAG